jgi:putative membrane protein
VARRIAARDFLVGERCDMEPEYWWHGGWWFLWILPVLILVAFAILFVGDPRSRWHRIREHAKHADTARDILDRRYATGEISREQYEEMRGVLHH